MVQIESHYFKFCAEVEIASAIKNYLSVCVCVCPIRCALRSLARCFLPTSIKPQVLLPCLFHSSSLKCSYTIRQRMSRFIPFIFFVFVSFCVHCVIHVIPTAICFFPDRNKQKYTHKNKQQKQTLRFHCMSKTIELKKKKKRNQPTGVPVCLDWCPGNPQMTRFRRVPFV